MEEEQDLPAIVVPGKFQMVKALFDYFVKSPEVAQTTVEYFKLLRLKKMLQGQLPKLVNLQRPSAVL